MNVGQALPSLILMRLLNGSETARPSRYALCWMRSAVAGSGREGGARRASPPALQSLAQASPHDHQLVPRVAQALARNIQLAIFVVRGDADCDFGHGTPRGAPVGDPDASGQGFCELFRAVCCLYANLVPFGRGRSAPASGARWRPQGPRAGWLARGVRAACDERMLTLRGAAFAQAGAARRKKSALTCPERGELAVGSGRAAADGRQVTRVCG